MPRINTAEVEETAQGGGVQAVQLALGVIEHLASNKASGVTEIANALGSTKARVFRHLRTLVEQGYATQDKDSERYSAGPRLMALARIASLAADDSIIKLARPVVRRLRDELGHTVNLSIVYGDSVSIMETLPGTALIEVVIRTNSALPLHCSAAGKLLLADRFAHGKPLPLPRLEKLTDNTIVDHAALEIELARVRQQGWSAAPEEMVLGVNAISAPIYSQRSELVGMISIVGSIQFISRQPSRDLIDAVTRAAKDISALLSL